MAIQYSVSLRNNQLDQVESTIGTSAKLQLRTGGVPANCAAANTGSLLIEIACPSDYMAAASAGAKALAGSWSGAATGAGTAAHFRMFDSTSTTCGVQGTVTATGGGGDMTLDNVSIAVGQVVTITSFGLTAGNA